MNKIPNILIVDDIESNRLIFEKILSSLEVNICLSESGEDAIKKLDEDEFALVLLDIKMPGMDGFETLERIRRKPKFELLPVIFVSAVFTDESYRLKGVRSGSVDFLEKPVVPEVLVGKVSTYLKIYHQQRKILEYVEFQKDFLAKMSHEIRNPMNSILGMVDLLSELQIPTEGKKWLNVLQVAGENLLGIVDDILDISKIEAGEFDLNYDEFNLKDHIENLILLFQKKAMDNDVNLEAILGPQVPSKIIGDKLRIWQILSNVVGNAIKFTKKGSVHLKVDIEKLSDKELVHFEVKDSGIGISQDRLKHIFKRYTQVDSSIASKFGGTGLGLQISSQLVELMGGDIWVESKVGEGTSFHITIPFSLRQEKKREKILIVEDNADLRTVMALELEEHFDTVVAEDGKEALEKILREKIDCVITDLEIPIFDGVELLRRIRNKGSSVPVIIISGQHEEFIKEKVKNIPEVKVFSKPVDTSKLIEGIKRSPQKELEMVPLDLLLVDDSEDNQLLVCAYLKETPFSVECAANGQEALAKLEHKAYDVVIMDTNMPIMDGNTATKKIRSLDIRGKNGQPILVIALSAYATDKEKNESIQAGHDSYLTKPIKKKVLIAKILELTESRGLDVDDGNTQ